MGSRANGWFTVAGAIVQFPSKNEFWQNANDDFGGCVDLATVQQVSAIGVTFALAGSA